MSGFYAEVVALCDPDGIDIVNHYKELHLTIAYCAKLDSFDPEKLQVAASSFNKSLEEKKDPFQFTIDRFTLSEWTVGGKTNYDVLGLFDKEGAAKVDRIRDTLCKEAGLVYKWTGDGDDHGPHVTLGRFKNSVDAVVCLHRHQSLFKSGLRATLADVTC
jgi:2'-5' RNA ligase